jgi:hypothetical protein
MDEPVTWFHGLIAERTAVFCPDAIELPFISMRSRASDSLRFIWVVVWDACCCHF